MATSSDYNYVTGRLDWSNNPLGWPTEQPEQIHSRTHGSSGSSDAIHHRFVSNTRLRSQEQMHRNN
jgi:hypothetical protein